MRIVCLLINVFIYLTHCKVYKDIKKEPKMVSKFTFNSSRKNYFILLNQPEYINLYKKKKSFFKS